MESEFDGKCVCSCPMCMRRAAKPVPPSPQPGTPLTLEAAVGVLNERRHRKRDNWKVHTGKFGHNRWAVTDKGDAAGEFEAIAIAERYLRDAPDAPAQEGARDEG